MAHSIRTTVVGSYPIPRWLVGTPSSLESRTDALTVVVRAQENAGIDVVTDGEIGRFDPVHPETNGMIDYFVSQMEGVSMRLTREELRSFNHQPGMSFRKRPAGIVRDPLGEGTLDLFGDFEAVRSVARKPLKFTVTSPYMLAKTLLDRHYRDLSDLVMEIAEILRLQVAEINAAVIQIDEANLPGQPQDWQIAARAINHVLSDSPSKEKGVHLCFGNYGGQTIQKGFWESLLPFFNSLECDHLMLEFARRGYGELDVFSDLRNGIALGIGVIDIKDNQIESAEQVARNIDTCVRVLGKDRIRWVCPDCGFWMLPRTIADGKMRSLVEGRNLVEGRSGPSDL